MSKYGFESCFDFGTWLVDMMHNPDNLKNDLYGNLLTRHENELNKLFSSQDPKYYSRLEDIKRNYKVLGNNKVIHKVELK